MTISELAERAPIIVLSKKACVQCNMSKKLLTGKLGEPTDGTWVTAMIDEDPDLYAEVAEKYPDAKAAPVILLPGQTLEEYDALVPGAAKYNEVTDTVYFTGFVHALLSHAAEKVAEKVAA